MVKPMASPPPVASSVSPFAALGLSPPLLSALATMAHHVPTDVQAHAIPVILRGGDAWASARTGSGKTAAFVLPMLQLLAATERNPSGPVRALIVVPTRELALQIGQAIPEYGQDLPQRMKTCVAVGGVASSLHITELRRGVDIVVGTPGRLLDLVSQSALRLGQVQLLILDEADRLLALGFTDEITRLCACLPARRQNLLFSATYPAKVRRLADGLLHNPTAINIDAGAAPDLDVITQRALQVDASRRTALLHALLQTHQWSQVLIFVATTRAADHLSGDLLRSGGKAAALHGELPQEARTKALADFKARRVQILVATDLAARGLDIVGLPAVVNYDLPRSPLDYVHRIGRTGRAGVSGMAVSFISAATEAHFRLIEKRQGMRVPREQVSGFEPTNLVVPKGDPHGGVKGKRKSKKDKLREAAARGSAKTVANVRAKSAAHSTGGRAAKR